jgi:hypothetical protein
MRAVVTVTVCVGHPPIEGVTHPRLCLESSNPVVRKADSASLFAEGGAFRLSRKSHSLVLSAGAPGSHHCLKPAFLSGQLSLPQFNLSATIPHSSHPVLLL